MLTIKHALSYVSDLAQTPQGLWQALVSGQLIYWNLKSEIIRENGNFNQLLANNHSYYRFRR